MKLFIRYIIFAFLLFFFMDCKIVKGNNPDDIYMNFRIVESNSYGGISTPIHRIVKNKAEFDSLFSELHKNIYPIPSMKYLSKKDYIFITFGEKSSGSLDYTINKIEKYNHTIIVTLQTIQKEEPFFSTDAIASPYIVVEIDKTNSDKVELKTEQRLK